MCVRARAYLESKADALHVVALVHDRLIDLPCAIRGHLIDRKARSLVEAADNGIDHACLAQRREVERCMYQW